MSESVKKLTALLYDFVHSSLTETYFAEQGIVKQLCSEYDIAIYNPKSSDSSMFILVSDVLPTINSVILNELVKSDTKIQAIKELRNLWKHKFGVTLSLRLAKEEVERRISDNE